MITLSNDQKSRLRLELTNTANLRVYRRATALLALHEGLPPGQVANLLGISRQTLYNWIITYGGAGENFELADSPRSGRPTLWTEDLRRFVQETISQSPSQLGYEVAHWTAKALQTHLATSRKTHVSKEALRRYLRILGYVWKNGRYVPDLVSIASASVTAGASRGRLLLNRVVSK